LEKEEYEKALEERTRRKSSVKFQYGSREGGEERKEGYRAPIMHDKRTTN
jgi:hypothetical protein